MDVVVRGITGRLSLDGRPVASFYNWRISTESGQRRIRLQADKVEWHPLGLHRTAAPGLRVELDLGANVARGKARVLRTDPLELIAEEISNGER